MNKRILLACLLVPLLTACSARTASNAANDFVIVAYGNAEKRDVEESRPESQTSSNNTRKDVSVRIFSAIFGALSRTLNGD
ncbi:hypothetical protein [Shewanella sp. TC10]|uniref:hypothetical protein n=1 Tax=Shewanella sp. TC10 TaxID=1419739 RepID=UPI00129DA7B4|nr:hypothetical protein [Shewanella sp. TC10]